MKTLKVFIDPCCHLLKGSEDYETILQKALENGTKNFQFKKWGAPRGPEGYDYKAQRWEIVGTSEIEISGDYLQFLKAVYKLMNETAWLATEIWGEGYNCSHYTEIEGGGDDDVRLSGRITIAQKTSAKEYTILRSETHFLEFLVIEK